MTPSPLTRTAVDPPPRSTLVTRLAWYHVLAALGALCSTGCTAAADSPRRDPVSVFAASSLVDAFGEMERAFERAHPEVDVQMTFAGSQVLRLQLEQGAPAHVFASANEAHMRALAEEGLVAEPEPLGTNDLVVVAPMSNPAGIESFSDLAQAERIVIGAPNVPIGAYTNALLDKAAEELGAEFATRVRSRVVSEESNVRLVRAKVQLGEADAGIVYRTDAVTSEQVRMIAVPAPLRIRVRYLIAATRSGSTAQSGSRAGPSPVEKFVAFTRSEAGRRILWRYGFGAEDP
jgi:molybdate transport system substrate-binding protein